MKITRIELQKNDNTRFSLFSDDQYVMSVSAENLAPYGYGEFEISEEELEILKAKEEEGLFFKQALLYVSKALKTSKEVRDYLYKKKVSPELQDEIIEKLLDLKLLDDERYLEMYLEEKFNYSTDGSIKIKHKLYQKGFQSKDVDPLLPKYQDLEISNLKKLVSDRKKSRKNEDKQKLIRYLMNKGYEYSMISEVVKEEEYYE
ncbi:MAG: hypothetical protein GXY89_08410 [Tissierellia bacterium]|jgi:regulatory protein|nr:hypothetical protein [Tissierellia bacterium]